MGRRKIEIKPIRDDRNRSVTFLKRKGGLFKKAHELSVLCSVDVAVVIFGHNKKLHEYSSSDINDIIGRFQYYGGAHEHKGPADFADKAGGDDDDDDEGGDDVDDHRSTPAPDSMMQPQMQNNPNYQHLRHEAPSGSPPLHNGVMPHFQRGPSPLPPGMSRPSSRTSQHPNHNRRPSSNLVPQTMPPHAPNTVPPPANYAYMPNPPFYTPPPAGSMATGSTYPPPSFPTQPSHHPQMQTVLMQEDRRQSMPATLPPQPTIHTSHDHLQPPPQPGHPSPQPPHPSSSSSQPPPRPSIPSPQPPQHNFQSPPMPQPKPLPNYAKSNIFTPIDDSRSMLAQHWGSTSSNDVTTTTVKTEDSSNRAQSVDVGSMNRERTNIGTNGIMASPKRMNKSPRPAERGTMSSPKIPPPVARTNTNQSDAKRPRLKVHIPNEASGDEGGGGSGPDETSISQPSGNSLGPISHHPAHGVVLPPPSPSASALLSAGASGPPNPFARPAPPMSTNPHAMNRDAPIVTGISNNMETPMSALPSRFVSDNLLPSPSTFYPEWGFGRSGGDMLPSPLNFQTPVVGNGVGWRDEESLVNRKRPGEDGVEGDAKKSKP